MGSSSSSRDPIVMLCRYVNGVHYSRTLEAWLRTHDKERRHVSPILDKAYGGPTQGWTVSS